MLCNGAGRRPQSLLLWPPGNNGSSGLKRAEAVLQAVQPKAAEMQTRSQIQIAGAGAAGRYGR